MSESTRMMLGLAIGKKKEEWALAVQFGKCPFMDNMQAICVMEVACIFVIA